MTQSWNKAIYRNFRGIGGLICVVTLFLTQPHFRFIHHSHDDGLLSHTHTDFARADDHRHDDRHHHEDPPHAHRTHHYEGGPVLEKNTFPENFHWHTFDLFLNSLVLKGTTLSFASLASRFEPDQARWEEEVNLQSYQARAPPLYTLL